MEHLHKHLESIFFLKTLEYFQHHSLIYKWPGTKQLLPNLDPECHIQLARVLAIPHTAL